MKTRRSLIAVFICAVSMMAGAALAQQIVSIDIQPSSDKNIVKPSTDKKLKVAVFTTNDFDAVQVDPQSVSFGPCGASDTDLGSDVKDIDKDGNMDVLFVFNTRESGIYCEATDATLNGETFSGRAITGTDFVATKCKLFADSSISPDSAPPGQSFTITDPLKRIQPEDTAYFYLESTDPIDTGVPAIDVSIINFGNELRGKVPDTGFHNVLHYIRVAPSPDGCQRFPDLPFTVKSPA